MPSKSHFAGLASLFLFTGVSLSSGTGFGQTFEKNTEKRAILSLQYKATTANAGGQKAYALRYSPEPKSEWVLFANDYIRTGQWPLTGLMYDLRFSVCTHACWLQAVFQVGAGFSTAGPSVEVLWSFVPNWLLRIDIATHLYFSRLHPIVWNYPLWIGLTFPL